ncbi:MAG: hypothetical protein FJX77_00265 [Armatimonadetes bacterium]|nr:hypothetical protein [Armatimonadota bacterium]
MNKNTSVALWLVGATLGILGGCDSGPSAPKEQATWEVIQSSILASNCTSCHAPGTSTARQSGLVLTQAEAYAQLVNTTPRNPEAAKDGLMRVSTQGSARLDQSYLWHKINAGHEPEGHHAANYGETMPPGGPALTRGELEFIRAWILAGAPRQGVVADPALLADTFRPEAEPFAALAPPAQGLQLHLGPFAVAANFEREVFIYQLLNNVTDIYVNRIEVAMRPGSHHFLAYFFPDYTPEHILPQPEVMRDLRDATGSYMDEQGNDLFDWRVMQYHKPIAISQLRRLDYQLPPGVAIRLPAGTGLDLNAHYANYSSAEIQGEAYLNLHLIEPAQVEHEVQVFALSNFDIDLPPGQVTTLEQEFRFKEKRHVLQLVSHAHDRMTEFQATVLGGPRDGEVIYTSYDWEHAPLIELDPPLVLEAGEGFKISATYNNTTDRRLFFGFTRQDEMMILYGYSY